jgi:Ca-activated chloride channel family protein
VQALGSAETPSGRQLYCGVKNHGTQPARVVLDLLADGKAVDSAEATVAPGEVWGRTVAVPRRAMVFEARLAEGGGALAADDVAYHVQDPGATVRALIVGPGDFFTERALVLDPRVTLDRAASLPESERPGSPGAPGYDIVVFSGVPEQETKARGVLTLGQAGPSSPVQATGRWQRPGAFVTTDDPLLQGVSFDGVFVESGEKVRPRGSGRVLADCDQGPVVVASGGPTRRVYLAFRPLDSDFPLNVSFPIFVANAIDFLAPKQAGGSFVLQPARPALIPWPTDGDVGVSGPGGFAATWKSTGGRLAVKNLDLAGVYRLGQGSGAKTLYAGLRSETESSIAPRTTVELGDESVVRQSAPFRFVDFWRPILLVLLVVLGIEWWLYGRLS